MAYRKRRRSGGTWLPVLPTFIGEADEGYTWYESTLSLVNTVGSFDRQAVPLVTDATPNVDAAQAGINHSLRDLVEGQEYVLKRAVGKVWGSLDQSSEGSGVSRIILCMALAVLPVQDVAPTAPAIPDDDWDPLLAQNTMSPYLWRRTWVLSNNVLSSQTMFFPNSTGGYGSVMDGGHLDTKGTNRRIRKEERIFILTSAMVQDAVGTGGAGGVLWGYDLRFFGAMRRARNQSTFK